jgi:hypothetical protein
MTLFVLGQIALVAAGVSLSPPAAAQISPFAYPTIAPGAPAEDPPVASPAPPEPTAPSQVAQAGAAGTAPPAPAQPPAPAAATDLTGAIGFGVGLIPNTQLLVGTSAAVALKLWITNKVALSPLLSLRFEDPSGRDASWTVRPEVVVLFSPFASSSTRFQLGGGLGFSLVKPPAADVPTGNPAPTTTSFIFSLPLQAGVEHFFKPWLSIGIAARAPLIEITKEHDFSQFALSLDSTRLLAQLFIYSE